MISQCILKNTSSWGKKGAYYQVSCGRTYHSMENTVFNKVIQSPWSLQHANGHFNLQEEICYLSLLPRNPLSPPFSLPHPASYHFFHHSWPTSTGWCFSDYILGTIHPNVDYTVPAYIPCLTLYNHQCVLMYSIITYLHNTSEFIKPFTGLDSLNPPRTHFEVYYEYPHFI